MGEFGTMKILDGALMQDLTAQAQKNPRLRQHHNLHDSYDEPSQRLLNAMEPNSYIRPHRHLSDPKPEAFIGIRGKMALLIFSDDGKIKEVYPFGPNEDVVGVDLPSGIWHTVVSLEQGSIFYETKPGPFNPINPKDFAPWAPDPGGPEALEYLQSLVALIRRG